MTQENRTPSQSAVETRYILMPHHANQYGTAFGGTIISWIDVVASMAAQRHCRTEVVTVAVDSLHFKAPIQIGDHVILKAAVNFVSRSSMEVGVQVFRENPARNEKSLATTAHLTFVALDGNKRPTAAPAIVPETQEEKTRYENARKRLENRRKTRNS